MPFRLTPDQRAYRAEIAGRMRLVQLQAASANAEAAALAADIATTAQAEIDHHSDRWRSSRAGHRAQAWTDRWHDFRPDPGDADAVDDFNALPDAAE